ncbi:site-specific integrase [Neorhizobium galegae]|uniref:site-specific integrase n=1 Tax=Neorhizobium galegae TaxID=399 RepID=UPI001F2A57E4|nr:site-specific integrase [Neorhizobium galegae]UIK06201.1 site-specific integrase [Neorhizobium galegae]
MTRRSNLIRRDGGTYYARIYIPSDLRDQFPSEDKKVSLRTKDEAVAKRRLSFELQKWDAEFEDMRARRHLTDEDRAVAVWEHYEARLNRDTEKRRAMPTDADLENEVARVWQRIDRGEIRSDDLVGMINGYADLELLKRAREDDANLRARRLAALRRDLATGRYMLVDEEVRQFIERHLLLVDHGSEQFRELGALMMRADIEALERTVERDVGDYSGRPKDPIVRPAFAKPRETAPPGQSIAELFEVYARENPRGVTADTLAQARRDIGLFVDHVGSTLPASKIDKKAVREWKALLIRYPVKAVETKVFEGMKIAQIVTHNESVGKPVLSANTVNRYLSNLAAFCSWLVGHGYIDDNPTEGMFLAKDKRKKVYPFTVDQMNALFRSPLFAGCASDGSPRFWNKPGNVRIRDHRYWIPLIMLYSGARPGEIAQLSLADVREEQQTWIFDITETSDDGDEDIKRLKNDGSRRVVPVHRELISLGFLDYLAAIRGAGHTRVFPLAIRNDRGQMLSDFSRDFGRYLEKINLKKGRGLSLYSFRHGAFDAMRRAGYLDEQFNFIFGHVSSGNRVTKGYGVLTQGMLEQRAKLVNAIEYPGLELEHLQL